MSLVDVHATCPHITVGDLTALVPYGIDTLGHVQPLENAGGVLLVAVRPLK